MACPYDGDSTLGFRVTGGIATTGQIGQIRESFDAMGLSRRKVAEAFYRRFFELVPEARRMFPEDMERLHLKLMDTIVALVGALDNPELFQSIIAQVGRHHARFGVTPSQLTAFGDALLQTWEQHFGPAFTPELRQAWTTLYATVQRDMVQAMKVTKPAENSGRQ